MKARNKREYYINWFEVIKEHDKYRAHREISSKDEFNSQFVNVWTWKKLLGIPSRTIF